MGRAMKRLLVPVAVTGLLLAVGAPATGGQALARDTRGPACFDVATGTAA